MISFSQNFFRTPKNKTMDSPSLTLHDGQQDNDDYKEEGNVKEEAEELVRVPVCRLQDVCYPSARPQALVKVVDETLRWREVGGKRGGRERGVLRV